MHNRPITTSSTTSSGSPVSFTTVERIPTTPIPVTFSSTTLAPRLEETSPLAALLNVNPIPASPEADSSLESHSEEEALLDEEEEEHDDEEHEIEDEDESEGRSQQDDDSEGQDEHQQLHEEEESVPEEHDIPVEQKLKQITREIEEMTHSDRDVDNGRQSFLSLSDLIKNIRPAEKVIPQIDSSYSNTMRVLGESITHGESRAVKV
ncbi:AAEL010994-PA [Aedes aegypti]|uniref:AAEL010994-PA n=1 Tax=Aedes aegypti TaxID=7159 RepID=Q16RE0_AEDAE|nr:AAEL010994-PA [Aedes aegypti]